MYCGPTYSENILYLDNNDTIFAAAVGLLSCAPLSGAASSGLVLGSITFIMSILCCAHCLNMKSPTVRCLCCSAVTLLTLAFLATLIANTVFVANFINNPAGICSSTEVAPAVMGLSWILLPLFGLFCLCSTFICVDKPISDANNVA